jgi:hypothetical protein
VTRFVCEQAAQNIDQSIFCENEYTIFTVKKNYPIFCAISVILKTMHKVTSRPMGEIRPIWSPWSKAMVLIK